MTRRCSIANALGVVGERWSLLVVRELIYGSHRFGQIAAGTGAPTDVLSTRLRKLVQEGVIETRQYSARPPRVEYHLTEAGRDLTPMLLLLLDWGDRWVSESPPIQVRHEVEHGEDHPVQPVVVCAGCGQGLDHGVLTAVSPEGRRARLSAG